MSSSGISQKQRGEILVHVLAVGRNRYRGNANRQMPGGPHLCIRQPNNEVHNPSKGLASLTVQELSCAAERLRPTFLVASQRAWESELLQILRLYYLIPPAPIQAPADTSLITWINRRVPILHRFPPYFPAAHLPPIRDPITVRASFSLTNYRPHHHYHTPPRWITRR